MTLPDGVAQINEMIVAVDGCFQNGFTNLTPNQITALDALQRIFVETPLETKLNDSLEALKAGLFQPEHFAVLAAARSSLQGTLHDYLLQHLRTQIGRASKPTPIVATEYEDPTPLFVSTGHWLMDIAIEGFSRLEPTTILPFLNTLSQLRDNPDHAPLAALLTNFIHELLQYVPVKDDSAIPLYRWCDLWSRAMLLTVEAPIPHAPQPISGTFYPLGIDWRQQPNVISLVVYGVLEHDDQIEWIRLTRSAYSVDAIYDAEAWLLFPDMEIILNGMATGNVVEINNMDYLLTGDLLWDREKAILGGGYKLMDTAAAHLESSMPTLPPEKRHPIHIAEPILLEDYQIEDNQIKNDRFEFILDTDRILHSGLELGSLSDFNRMFGLIRYDNLTWRFQPLATAKGKGKPTFVGQAGAKILKKPPKTSTVFYTERTCQPPVA